MRTLAIVHLIGNAVLLGLGYYWLGLGETRATTLLWSAVVALALLLLASLLHAAALRTRTLRLLAVAVATVVVYALLERYTTAALWPIRWMAIPVIALAAATGSRRWRQPLYWLAVPALLLAAIWVPLKLLAWVPHAGTFGLQLVSFGLRALIAYLLFTGATLALELATRSGKRA